MAVMPSRPTPPHPCATGQVRRVPTDRGTQLQLRRAGLVVASPEHREVREAHAATIVVVVAAGDASSVSGRERAEVGQADAHAPTTGDTDVVRAGIVRADNGAVVTDFGAVTADNTGIRTLETATAADVEGDDTGDVRRTRDSGYATAQMRLGIRQPRDQNLDETVVDRVVERVPNRQRERRTTVSSRGVGDDQETIRRVKRRRTLGGIGNIRESRRSDHGECTKSEDQALHSIDLQVNCRAGKPTLDVVIGF